MARTMATVKVTLWSDEDFIRLSGAAQRLYLLVLSQARVSLAGHLDYMPQRWANLAPDTTVDDIETTIAELESAGFVAIDRATEELVIRSFIAHDIGKNYRRSSKIGKGLWAAWEGILSAKLRDLVVRSAPDDVWDDLEPTAPAAAVQTRRSAHIETEPPPPIETDPPIHTDSPEPEPEPEPEPRAAAPFDQFWAVYPIKRDKKNARPAFDRAVAEGTDPSEIIEGAERYAAKVARRHTPESCIKYPQGWLNDGRWREDLDFPDPDTNHAASDDDPDLNRSMSPEQFDAWEANEDAKWQEYLAANGGTP